MPRIELHLPDLGLDDQPLLLSGWLVSRGAHVETGDSVAEILAGPATIDLPTPVAGRILKRSVGVDESLAVGQLLAVIEADFEP